MIVGKEIDAGIYELNIYIVYIIYIFFIYLFRVNNSQSTVGSKTIN